MKRTLLGPGVLALSVAALTLGLSSCSTVPAKAATVDGSDISRSDFERDLQALAARPEVFGLTPGTGTTIQGDAARGWLSQLITWQAAQDILAAHGLEPSQAAIDDLTTQLSSGPAVDLPQGMKDEFIQGNAAVQSLSLVPAPSSEELAALYAEQPASTGVVCARHILVASEAEAKAVLDELEGGADFAELAAERSTEPAATDTGGALASQDGNACLTVGTYQSQFDPAFAAEALAARPGVPTDPVESQFGWHVILIRPFDEVGEDASALIATAPGDAALAATLATADVTVDARYGRWSPTTGNVVSLH